LILVILPFTGLLGIDHLALRSPITAILKMISIIPLFGFWYFYDIAQVCGERDLIEKYGIGVPLFGPIGLGAGIFTKDGIKESPKDIPRPWLFIAYTIVTILLFFLPINKFLIGDTAGGIFYLLFFLTGIGIIQGLYDIFNLIFNTKSLFEKGTPRIPGVSFLLGEYFYSSSLGNTPSNAAKNESSVIGTITTAVGKIIPTVGNVIKSVGTGATVGAASVLAEKAHVPEISSIENAGDAAGRIVGTEAAEAAAAQLELAAEGSKAAAGAASAVGAVTDSIKKNPEALLTGSVSPFTPTVQKGGGLDLLIPSIPVLLFTVSLLAFSGYVFYIFKNTHRKSEKTDDPPREPRAVRVPSEHRQ
jgi:hypothetical protein